MNELSMASKVLCLRLVLFGIIEIWYEMFMSGCMIWFLP